MASEVERIVPNALSGALSNQRVEGNAFHLRKQVCGPMRCAERTAHPEALPSLLNSSA